MLRPQSHHKGSHQSVLGYPAPCFDDTSCKFYLYMYLKTNGNKMHLMQVILKTILIALLTRVFSEYVAHRRGGSHPRVFGFCICFCLLSRLFTRALCLLSTHGTQSSCSRATHKVSKDPCDIINTSIHCLSYFAHTSKELVKSINALSSNFMI